MKYGHVVDALTEFCQAIIIFLTSTNIIRTKEKIQKTASYFRHGISYTVYKTNIFEFLNSSEFVTIAECRIVNTIVFVGGSIKQ